MYRVNTPDGNFVLDTPALDEAKRIADNKGKGASVWRWNQKVGDHKSQKVYVSDVARPTGHTWVDLEDVLSVLGHWLHDNGMSWDDLPNIQCCADGSFLFGVNLRESGSIKIVKER